MGYVAVGRQMDLHDRGNRSWHRSSMKDESKSFESILDMPISELTRPKPLPQGTYKTVVRGLPAIGKSTKKGTEFSEYTLQILEAYDDVDTDALEATLTKGNGEVQRLQDRSLRLTFYHTPASGYRLGELPEQGPWHRSQGREGQAKEASGYDARCSWAAGCCPCKARSITRWRDYVR